MAERDTNIPPGQDGQVVLLPRPKGPTPPRKALPTAEEVAAHAPSAAPPPAPKAASQIDPAEIVAKARASAPQRNAPASAPPPAAAPVKAQAQAPASTAMTPSKAEASPGRAAFEHHMTVRKADLVAEGMAQSAAHTQALAEWRNGERVAPPESLRRAGIRVIVGQTPPPPPANADRASAFRAQVAGIAQMFARCADRRGVPITMRLLPETEEGASWLVLTIGAAPGAVIEVQDEPEKAGIALGALLREWDAYYAPAPGK